MSWRSGLLLGLVGAVLLVAGCGSGSKSSSTSPTTRSTAAAASPSPPTTTSIPSTNGSSTAVLPANVVLGADGSLSPPQIAGPARTTIELTVTSHAAHPVHVAVASAVLTVPARAMAAIQIPGLKKGRYKIAVDGRTAGALEIGAQPGP